ncbi:MAG: ThuA domain-containing protein [Sphingomonadales bacterium]|nr:ThuA domain-containing protein [Sphingomonadales bacterium]
MLRYVSLTLAVLGAALLAVAPAKSRPQPLLDCPLRDAPYSVGSPLVDVLLNPQARKLTEAATAQDFSKLPPIFIGTKPPTFAAILTIKEAAAIGGADLKGLPALDAQLRALPVTRADKIARCSRYDDDRPVFKLPKGKVHLLLFEKINGFRDVPSVTAAHAALVDMARRKGWALVATDKAGVFHPATLAQFDAVIWNNISGDVLTLTQRNAFQHYLSQGGGFVGVHGSAGDPVYFWDWYPDVLIGARFAGHPMNPQFQEARIAVDSRHPLAKGLPTEWRMTDEWYSFKTNPRATGARVLLTLDESTYTRKGRFGEPLDMGADHPLAWTRCIGNGRAFYSAIGHLPETYSQPQAVRVLENAVRWAASRQHCR